MLKTVLELGIVNVTKETAF